MMAAEEKPPEIVLDLEKLDAAKRSIEETLEATAPVARPLGEKLLAIEKMAGLTDVTQKYACCTRIRHSHVWPNRSGLWKRTPR